jgi:hypothetical protein
VDEPDRRRPVQQLHRRVASGGVVRGGLGMGRNGMRLPGRTHSPVRTCV